MKHYFLVAKDVGDLTAILCARLEEEQAKPAPVLSRMVARLRPGTKRRRYLEENVAGALLELSDRDFRDLDRG